VEKRKSSRYKMRPLRGGGQRIFHLKGGRGNALNGGGVGGAAHDLISTLKERGRGGHLKKADPAGEKKEKRIPGGGKR